MEQRLKVNSFTVVLNLHQYNKVAYPKSTGYREAGAPADLRLSFGIVVGYTEARGSPLTAPADGC